MYFLYSKMMPTQSLEYTEIPALSPQMAEWVLYNNSTYKYQTKHPKQVIVQQVHEEERGEIQKSRKVVLFDPLYPTGALVEITAQNKFTLYGSGQTLNLKEYTELKRQAEISNKNSNYPNKKVSEVFEIKLSDWTGFSYEVTGSADGYGHADGKYLFLENADTWYIIYYPLNDPLSGAIVSTFTFSK